MQSMGVHDRHVPALESLKASKIGDSQTSDRD
jgi:hypothetical protein